MDSGVDRPIIPRYLTREHAAIYLDTTVEALDKRAERGELPRIKDGRRVRYDRFDLDTYLRERREEAWA